MRKKFLSCVLLVIACLFMEVLPVQAANFNEKIVYRWSYINMVEFYMNFNGTEGVISGEVDCDPAVTRIAGEIEFYYKNWFGFWVEDDQGWTYDESTNDLDIYKKFTAVSGREYKAVLNVTVYTSTGSEPISEPATGTCP